MNVNVDNKSRRERHEKYRQKKLHESHCMSIPISWIAWYRQSNTLHGWKRGKRRQRMNRNPIAHFFVVATFFVTASEFYPILWNLYRFPCEPINDTNSSHVEENVFQALQKFHFIWITVKGWWKRTIFFHSSSMCVCVCVCDCCFYFLFSVQMNRYLVNFKLPVYYGTAKHWVRKTIIGSLGASNITWICWHRTREIWSYGENDYI